MNGSPIGHKRSLRVRLPRDELVQQLSRKVCKCEQPCRRKSVTMAIRGELRMLNYPGRKTILCIADDHGMLGYQRALFERRGYNVLTANSARQGLQIIRMCGEDSSGFQGTRTIA